MNKCCTVCGETKQLEEFYNCRASKDGKSWRCKQCDKDSTLRSRKERGSRSRLQQRDANRRAKYGVTPDDFLQLWGLQGGACAICNVELTDDFCDNSVTNKAVIDHCHDTNKIRGLLCRLCNQGLGLFKDNPERLLAAANYLKVSN